MATKLFANYSFDRFGIGISSGVIAGSINDNAINRFMTDQKFPTDNIQINTSKPFNSYLLAGPSFRFGKRVGITASMQGGMFFNDPGSVSIQQQNAANNRLLYAFQDAGQKLFPGFAGNIHIAYPINNNTQFLINADYLHSRSSIQLIDPGNGIDIPTEQNRNVQLITSGIGIIRTFGGRSNNNRRTASYANVQDLITPSSHNNTGSANNSCGPVTYRTTHPDGSVQELTFACPDDAAAYTTRMTTTARQTQGSNFGERLVTTNADSTTMQSRVQDHNSSRSNKSSSAIAPDGGGGDAQQKVQDHNSSRSNKSASVADHNSSRSNKSASSIAVDADMNGDGVYETDITAKISDRISFNEQGEITEAPQLRAGVSTSRSGIIRTRSSLQPAGNDLYVCHGTAEIDNKTVPVRIIYK